MTDLSPSERAVFQSTAAEVAAAFAESEPSEPSVHPDPASTIDPHPELGTVEQLVEKIVPPLPSGLPTKTSRAYSMSA